MAHLFQSMPALLSEVGQINVKKGKLEPDKQALIAATLSGIKSSNTATPYCGAATDPSQATSTKYFEGI